MSNARQQVNHGHTHTGVGVNGYSPPKEVYEPRKHNKPSPMRTGSMDAFKKPSLDHANNRRPYWGNTE